MSKVVGGCRPLRLRPCVLRGGCKLSESAQVGPRGRVFDRSGPLLYMDDYMKNYDIPATYYYFTLFLLSRTLQQFATSTQVIGPH